MKKSVTLSKNDILTLEIEDITNLGFGVGKHEGAVIFVSGAVTGDTVEVKIIKVATSYYVGRVEKFIKRSPIRTDDRCHNKRCHACAYRDVLYSEELKIKEAAVRAAFLKEGLADAVVLPTVPSPRLTEYRNKAQYPIARGADGEYIIGFYAPKSHNVCEAADCPMAPVCFTEILETLREFFARYDIPVYEEISGEGLLRHIYLRRSEALGQILLTIVINGHFIPHSDELVKVLTGKFPEICGILLNINTADTNVVLGEGYIKLYGTDSITDILSGVKLTITPQSFYQVNHGGAGCIYERARELAELSPSDIVLDLFCGTGSIGLSMAKDCREVIGIEIVESAVKCAKENARANNIENASFYTGDATSAEKILCHAEAVRGERIKPDVVILDPPRGGSERGLLEFIAKLSPRRVVYVSCNPTTLARDVKIMSELGYSYGEVSTVDMFPMTGHVESVVCLTRRLDN